jgi:hypothetical protein
VARIVQRPLSNCSTSSVRASGSTSHTCSTPARRLQLALSLSASVIELAYAGIRRRSPGISDEHARLQFVEIHYGPELAHAVRARLRADRRAR